MPYSVLASKLIFLVFNCISQKPAAQKKKNSTLHCSYTMRGNENIFAKTPIVITIYNPSRDRQYSLKYNKRNKNR